MSPSIRRLDWTLPSGKAFSLDFSRPLVMAVLNVTPDSFSDGGRFFDPAEALAQAERHISEGADILDIGAETTRPGSDPITADEEWRRLAPVLAALSRRSGCPPISVDTYRSGTAEKALEAGASILNDIYAGRKDPQMLPLAAKWGVPVILMHMQGEPRTMQKDPHYDDVVREVREFLLERARAAEAAGVAKERVILDPGIGFGKNLAHNLSLIKRFDEVMPRDYLSLMGLSRKAFLGRLLDGREPMGRDTATAAASALSVLKGAAIVRVHNTAATRDAVLVASAVMGAQ